VQYAAGRYIGLHADVKPAADTGAQFMESDTGDRFQYDGVAWFQVADLNAVIGAGESHLGAVGGHTAPITASKTRPNDTSAYAANDGIAEATSGATVWTFTGAARISGGSGIIVGAQVKCTNAANVARIEVDLYDSAPAAAINDNAEAVQLVADVAKFIATLTLPALAKKTTSSTFAIARDNTIRQAFKCSGSANLIGIVRTLDAFTPTAQSIYSLTLDCAQD
jgi:hypothetical protein